MDFDILPANTYNRKQVKQYYFKQDAFPWKWYVQSNQKTRRGGRTLTWSD